MSPPLVPDPPGFWNGGERPEVLLSHLKKISVSDLWQNQNQTQKCDNS